jgi:hypothetical protein
MRAIKAAAAFRLAAADGLAPGGRQRRLGTGACGADLPRCLAVLSAELLRAAPAAAVHSWPSRSLSIRQVVGSHDNLLPSRLPARSPDSFSS